MLIPRDYQQAAHDAAWHHMTTSLSSFLIEAATGAGKSLIVAMLAKTIRERTGKSVLCLAPSGELVEQNHEKYELLGEKASIMCAALGSKSIANPVVFGTPTTIKNRIRRFGSEFALVLVDEAQGITPTVRHIIDTLKEVNPRIRVGGLTATPYRLGTGYIYELDEADKGFDESQAIEPYFKKRVYAIQAPYLIKKGYLTPPVIGAINSSGYDTAKMQLNSRGQFDKADVDRAYHGHGRKTSAIVGDIVAQSQNRQGVLIFAATIQHAQEVMASLPPSLSAMVAGGTKKAERKRLLREFKARRIKYLVNVAVLTTGFDAPHVDVVALLRATESVGLLQQIIGRGLRLSDNKKDCLILDYAGNVERHCPDGDLFAPIVQATKKSKGKGFINAVCEACGDDNTFPARPNPDGHEIDKHGYFIDLDGNRIEGDIPAHFGRRCTSHHKAGAHFERCEGRWNAKKCPTCDAENDIAARYCSECKGEIVDPNDKLKADFKALKRDPSRVQTDEVLDFSYRKSISKRGNEVLRVDFVTPYRQFSVWYQTEAKHSRAIREYQTFMSVKDDLQTITYCKDTDSGFYRALGYNRAKDEIPSMA